MKDAAGKKDISIAKINALSGYSNKVMQLQLDDGRCIMVKQGHFHWAKPRFQSACRASHMLRQQSWIAVPEHISVSEVADAPTIAYWYLPFPTLKELWPGFSLEQKKQASKSLGHLLKEIHKVKVQSYGMLHHRHAFPTISSFMVHELNERLRPTITVKWPNMLPVLNQLMSVAEQLSDDKQDATLVHNDLHLGNILCEVESGEVKCIGLLDLEEARGGRWESDLASAITLHHPLFDREGENEEWLENFGHFIVDGYGKKPDPKLLRFFRVYHLLNLGLFSAMNEEHKHAQWVGEMAAALSKELHK